MPTPNPKFDPDKFQDAPDTTFSFGLKCDWDERKSKSYDLYPNNPEAVFCSYDRVIRKREGDSTWNCQPMETPAKFLRVWLSIAGNQNPIDQHGAEISVTFTLKSYQRKPDVNQNIPAQCPFTDGMGGGGNSDYVREWYTTQCVIYPGQTKGVLIEIHWGEDKNGKHHILGQRPIGACFASAGSDYGEPLKLSPDKE